MSVAIVPHPGLGTLGNLKLTRYIATMTSSTQSPYLLGRQRGASMRRRDWSTATLGVCFVAVIILSVALRMCIATIWLCIASSAGFWWRISR